MMRWLRGGERTEGAGALTAEDSAKVDHLVAMGFDEAPALLALRQNGWHVERAVEALLAAPPAAGTSAPPRTATQIQREERAAAAEQRASAHSRASARSHSSARHASGRLQAAASGVAGAASRLLKPRSLEQKLDDVCAKLAHHPAALDMLIYVIDTILNNPGEPKYREIKTTNRRFRETIGLAGAAGPELLQMLGFTRTGDWFVLRGAEDPARLYLGKSALEATVEHNPSYAIANDRIAFEKALKASKDSADREEAARREEFAPKVPVEPELGKAGTTRITVFCGGDVLQRRFNSDDIVDSILAWLGASYSSIVPGRLERAEWELVDKTLYPKRVVNLDEDRYKTLHAAKMWPSAELTVQAAGTLAHEELQEAGGGVPASDDVP